MLTVKVFTFNPFQENTYVLSDDSGQCIIIDPGCYAQEEKEVLSAYIQSGGLRPSMLINTHCHLDHIFGNAFVAGLYDLPLHLHKLEDPVLDFGPSAGLMYNLPFEHYTGPKEYLSAGQEIMLGEISFKVLFTPGHSPGRISLYCHSEDLLISGDVLFHRSIGRTDLPGGDQDVLFKTIRSELFVLPENTVVLSGHGPKTTIGEEKTENPFLNGTYPYFS